MKSVAFCVLLKRVGYALILIYIPILVLALCAPKSATRLKKIGKKGKK